MDNIELTTREQFIVRYRAALKVGLSREQLGTYLGMKPDTIKRKRLKILEFNGLELPPLELTGETDIPADLLDKFEEYIEQLEDNHVPIRIEEYDLNKRYVITSAQNATPVNAQFMGALLKYCDINNAELLVIPLRYRNPTSVWSPKNEGDEWWHPSVQPYIQAYSRKLSKSLEYMGHIKIQPTAIRPLNGLEGMTGLSSGIIGHPKVELKCIATPANSLPKILTTTGCITHPNYTDSKTGHMGAFHHSYAALIAEVDGDGHHHLRHIHWNGKGFHDLDSYYTQFSHKTDIRVLGIVTGDSHVEFIDKQVENATYVGPDSLCGKLNPEYLVWHDVEDFYRRNHHHIGDDVVAYGKHHFGLNNVEEGLQVTADFIDKYSNPDRINIITKSNHDEAFDRWLRIADPKLDPENAKFFYYMKYHQLKSVKRSNTGFDSVDPFAFWCFYPDEQPGLRSRGNTIFLDRDESVEIAGIETGFHGDHGTNGAKGSLHSFSKIGPKVIIGHSHTPGIIDGAYQVGMSAMLDLEYQSGPSSWMHTHCIIYPDGTRTLINIIDGKYHGDF